MNLPLHFYMVNGSRTLSLSSADRADRRAAGALHLVMAHENRVKTRHRISIIRRVLCIMFGSSGPANPASTLNTASALGFILTLPWNCWLLWVFSNLRSSEVYDHHVAIMMMLGGGVNAVLLYLIAIKLRRLIR